MRGTNICYLCHQYCFTCTQRFMYNCQACAAGYYKWQQYSNICHRYCRVGSYTAGGNRGEFIASNAATTRQCSICDPGCYYCDTIASNCFICQDNYYLVDDNTTCISTYSTTSSYYASVTDGCQSRNKYCRPTDCPAYFYFKVARGGATDAKYNYFTIDTTDKLDNTKNGYSSAAYPSNTNNLSPSPDTQYEYRNETNFCKLCHKGCIQCYGPTNYECYKCTDTYYLWKSTADRTTNLTICEKYCQAGQYRLTADTNYTVAVRNTECGACDWKCLTCEVWRDNCTSCTIFPTANYAFLFAYSVQNSTCLTTCPTSSTPLTQRGYYGSISTMICYPCPGGCSNCNINKVRTEYLTLQDIVCKSDTYCSKGVICTTCLEGYSLVGGTCVDQSTCRLYSYYVQGNSSTTWSPSNCKCLPGKYFSTSTTCAECDFSCLTCNGSSNSNCLTCPPGYSLTTSFTCTNSQVYVSYAKAISGSTFTGSGYLLSSFNNVSQCGTYYTLYGYQSGYTTGHHFYFTSPNYNWPNYYAINIRLKVLFIDQWDSTAGLYFRLGASSAYPFATYLYDTKGAIGEMQCGTNDYDYLLTLSATTAALNPTGNNSYQIYVNANKSPVQNLSGFYYHWGIHDAVVTVLKCHASCYKCTGPSENECTECWAADNKVLVNNQCLCNTNAGWWYHLNDPITAACYNYCPACTYNAVGADCYYRDPVRRMCVNPITNNCSAPYIFAEPYEISNSYGTCRLNCSAGKFAYLPLMKCTSNCAQFTGYYHYDGGYALGANMSSCVTACPMGLIRHPATKWCVTQCPTSYFLALENKTTDAYCTSNCTTGYEYDLSHECVSSCPAGYYTQTLSSHNKCVQTCTNAFGDNITSSCVLFCPTPSFADPATHLCAEECTNKTYEQISIANGNRTCVTVCETGQWLHPYYLNCSKNPMDCPQGTYADNNTHTCVPSCDPTHD